MVAESAELWLALRRPLLSRRMSDEVLVIGASAMSGCLSLSTDILVGITVDSPSIFPPLPCPDSLSFASSEVIRAWKSSKLTLGRKSKQPLSVRLFDEVCDCPKLKRGLEALPGWPKKGSLVDVGRKERVVALLEVAFAVLWMLVVERSH